MVAVTFASANEQAPLATALAPRVRAMAMVPSRVAHSGSRHRFLRTFAEMHKPAESTRRQICLGAGMLALSQALPSHSMDKQAAMEARLARKAKMKDKYGDNLSPEESRALKEATAEESKKQEQKTAAESGSEIGMNKDVAALKKNKEAQRESIRERLMAKGGASAGEGPVE
eukprot:CAMPEP_0184483474 /NCGR_PEP_ID=MMETSP0113_2-20130426/5119_1 /TAXON_ID=91329 /ORGANISM="Norrisiella sphaerica, Strain BC52" /LENGTH=171 /DNA_ID=CAMNT_0026863893 /DNA_START=216 /DNA_END=731 /DNA_ORIENTATION=-